MSSVAFVLEAALIAVGTRMWMWGDVGLLLWRLQEGWVCEVVRAPCSYQGVTNKPLSCPLSCVNISMKAACKASTGAQEKRSAFIISIRQKAIHTPVLTGSIFWQGAGVGFRSTKRVLLMDRIRSNASNS